MKLRLALGCLLFGACVQAAIVDDVRALIAAKDFAGAGRMVAQIEKTKGASPELAQAISWIARGELAIKNYDQAEAFAQQARAMSLKTLGTRKLDSDPWLPLALGAAIEVHGQVIAGRGDKPGAIEYFQDEFKVYGKTSLAERIRRNINLISLEGKPAPELEEREWFGPKPPTLASLKGRPVLLFFWAHWCPDCKGMAPILAKAVKTYSPKGLTLIGPTRYYGYVANGDDATPAVEKPYIEKIRREYYADLASVPAPLSSANFLTYGSATTPTLVFVDAEGIVRWYHPGQVTAQELDAKLKTLLK